MNLPYCQGQKKLHMWLLELKGTCVCSNSGPRQVQLRQLPLINLCLQLYSWAHLKHSCNENTSQRGGWASSSPCSGSIRLGHVCRYSVLPISCASSDLLVSQFSSEKQLKNLHSFSKWVLCHFRSWINFSLVIQWKAELAEVGRCLMWLGEAVEPKE